MTTSPKNKGVLLVNMGAPLSEDDMRIFLFNMFSDPHILPVPAPVRFMLKHLITNRRYKKSWQKYQLIGGSPLIEATAQTAEALSGLLPQYQINYAFSYSHPLVQAKLTQMKQSGLVDITVVPLYPHDSITTYCAVADDAEEFAKNNSDVRIRISPVFYTNHNYIAHFSALIKNHIAAENLDSPLFVFSAHSIPQAFVNKGDRYPYSIAESAKLIAAKAKIKYTVAFQSQVRGAKWIGPPTPDIMREAKKNGEKQVVLVPISFVCENLETLYDLDHDLVPFGRDELKFEHISRIRLPHTTPHYIEALKDVVLEAQQSDNPAYESTKFVKMM